MTSLKIAVLHYQVVSKYILISTENSDVKYALNTKLNYFNWHNYGINYIVQLTKTFKTTIIEMHHSKKTLVHKYKLNKVFNTRAYVQY